MVSNYAPGAIGVAEEAVFDEGSRNERQGHQKWAYERNGLVWMIVSFAEAEPWDAAQVGNFLIPSRALSRIPLVS